MLQHSFVLDALETTGADTFSHFEILIDEHRHLAAQENDMVSHPSRLKQLVPTIGMFHTHLPLRAAYEIYNEKHRLSKRKHIQISFNEIRHILNLAQIMALRKVAPHEDVRDPLLASMASLRANPADSSDQLQQHSRHESVTDDFLEAQLSADDKQLNGPRLISFDGDQTLYSDGENFERNPRLANYLYQLLRHGVAVAVVTAAGYEYNVSGRWLGDMTRKKFERLCSC